MALARKITKAQYDKLPDVIKAEYQADGEEFVLDVTGLEDTGALRRAKDREVQKNAELTTRITELETQVSEFESNASNKDKDIKTLEKSWQKKLDDAVKAVTETNGQLKGHVTKSLLDATAQALATKISTAPALLLPHIKNRMSVDFDGEEPTLRILDQHGKVSAMTVQDLEKEISGNKDFASIIVGSKASGSGAAGAGKQVSRLGGATQNDGKTPLFSQMSAKELASQIKANKEQQSNE